MCISNMNNCSCIDGCCVCMYGIAGLWSINAGRPRTYNGKGYAVSIMTLMSAMFALLEKTDQPLCYRKMPLAAPKNAKISLS